METSLRAKKERAKLKIERLKGLYTHAIIYGAINVLLFVIKLVGTQIYGENFMGPLWHFSTLMAPLFWGIGLFVHAFRTFGFGKNWEDRQIRKYLEDESIASEKK